MGKMQFVQKKPKMGNTVLAIIVTVGFICLICILYDLYYAVNDDVIFGKRLSGCYTGEPYAVATLIQYPLACIISFLFRIFSGADVYGIFLVSSHFLCLFLIIKKMLDKVMRFKKELVVFASAVFLVFDMTNVLFFQFTTTAAIYAATGVFFLLLEEPVLKSGLPSICLLLMALCIRKEIFIMIMPFVILAWFTKIYKGSYRSKEIVKAGVLYFLVLGILAESVVAIHEYKNAENRKNEYLKEFDVARNDIRDYDGVPDYDTNLEFYQKLGGQGISNAEYLLIRYQMVTMDFSIDVKEIVSEMYQYNLENRKKLGIKQIMMLKIIKFWPIFQRILIWPQVIGSLIMAIILSIYFIYGKKWRYFLFLCGGCFGIMSEIMYLVYRGRLPERTIQSFMLSAVFWMLGIFIQALCERGNGDDISEKKVYRLVCGIITLLYIGIFFSLSLPAFQRKQVEYAERNRLSTLVDEYCANHSENIYFSPYRFLSGDTDRLGNEYTIQFDNRIRIGLSPFTSWYYSMLERAGIVGTIEEAIMTQPNVFLIGQDAEGQLPVLDNYFIWKYGNAYSHEVVEELGDSIYVWKVHMN